MENNFKEEIQTRLKYEKEFEKEVMGILMFMRSLSERKIAEFIVHQNRAIDGLTKNNGSFREAFHNMTPNKTLNLT